MYFLYYYYFLFYYRLYLPGPQHFFRNSNRAMATGWSFTRTLFPPLTRHPVYSATVCCAVFSPPYSHLILVQSSSAHPARTPHALRFLSRWERRMKRARPWEVTIEEEAAQRLQVINYPVSCLQWDTKEKFSVTPPQGPRKTPSKMNVVSIQGNVARLNALRVWV